MDTIYALATPPGRSALAIIRMSGPDTNDILSALSVKMPCPVRMPVLGIIHDPETHDILDQAVILNFKAPSSFTGEDAAEITLHGGPAVVTGVMAALSKTKKCRMAEPGEFTKRAFLNGKMDLTQAEAIAAGFTAAWVLGSSLPSQTSSPQTGCALLHTPRAQVKPLQHPCRAQESPAPPQVSGLG